MQKFFEMTLIVATLVAIDGCKSRDADLAKVSEDGNNKQSHSTIEVSQNIYKIFSGNEKYNVTFLNGGHQGEGAIHYMVWNVKENKWTIKEEYYSRDGIEIASEDASILQEEFKKVFLDKGFVADETVHFADLKIRYQGNSNGKDMKYFIEFNLKIFVDEVDSKAVYDVFHKQSGHYGASEFAGGHSVHGGVSKVYCVQNTCVTMKEGDKWSLSDDDAEKLIQVLDTTLKGKNIEVNYPLEMSNFAYSSSADNRGKNEVYSSHFDIYPF